jgi:polyphosphate kinase
MDEVKEMKITKSQLKQIIKEELEAIQEETPEQLADELRTTLRQLRMGPGVHVMIEKAKNLLGKALEMNNNMLRARDALDALNSIPEELLVDLSHLSRRDPERNQIRTALFKFLQDNDILKIAKSGIADTIFTIAQ